MLPKKKQLKIIQNSTFKPQFKKNSVNILRLRETDSRFKIHSDEIFAFDDSDKLSLERYFIKGNTDDLFGFLRTHHKSIYYIHIIRNKLTYTEYSNISKKDCETLQLKEDKLLKRDNQKILYDVEGNVTPEDEDKSNFSDDNELKHFLFTDGFGRYYYIDYTKNSNELFKLFEDIYGKKLNLKIYEGKILSSNNDVLSFLTYDTDEYSRLYDNIDKHTGGRISNKIKIIKIIKSYK